MRLMAAAMAGMAEARGTAATRAPAVPRERRGGGLLKESMPWGRGHEGLYTGGRGVGHNMGDREGDDVWAADGQWRA
jgi:hypothetical protein